MRGPTITDHALLRFLERGGGMDVEGLRTALSASLARAHHAACQLGEEEYLVKVGDSTFVVRDGSVTTVQFTSNSGAHARALKREG